MSESEQLRALLAELEAASTEDAAKEWWQMNCPNRNFPATQARFKEQGMRHILEMALTFLENPDPQDGVDIVYIHCDGGASPNPGFAGIGAVLEDSAGRIEMCGSYEHLTNNEAELLAAIRALDHVTGRREVVLRTDSAYVVSTMKGEWKRRANHALWTELDRRCMFHEVTFEKVPGHKGERWNERAHTLASTGIARAREGRFGVTFTGYGETERTK